MIRIMIALMFALLLTACEAKENGQDKKFEPEEKTTLVKKEKDEADEISKKITELTQETKKEPEETYAKNIFELVDVDGNTIHVDEAKNGIIFQEHKDKVVFLLFFGYRCPPCLAEIPAIKKMVEAKGDKLEVIALEVQRLPEEQLKIFKTSKKLNYTVLSGEHTDNSEFISYIAQRAQWSGSIPFLVGITPKGEVAVVHVGGMKLADFEKVFEQISKIK